MKELLFWEADEASDSSGEESLTTSERAARAEKRDMLEARARKELRWFYDALGGRVPGAGTPQNGTDQEGTTPAGARGAALAIRRWLDAIPAFHRGALELRYTPRAWPEALERRYDGLTSLVVRLECVSRPGDGHRKTSAALEREAVERIQERLRTGERDQNRLLARARAHVSLALRAYVKVRGDGPSFAPRPVVGSCLGEGSR